MGNAEQAHKNLP